MMCQKLKQFMGLGMIVSVFLLAGCSSLTVLDPKGPVGAQQKDLIMWSIGFMLFIVAVVFVLFTWILVKYRERPQNAEYEPPQRKGSWFLESIWTIIPIIIVIALAIPTVSTIYSLEEPPKETAHKDPLVIHVTSVDWKWIFSYPEQHIETVNYVNIPAGKPIQFKLTSADSMASFWVPSLGGQKYAMSDMEMTLYLQADEPGSYKGRNANFTGEGFADQKFIVKAQTKADFEQWVEETQNQAPKLTQEQYDRLMLQGHADEMTFSSTHLTWVDHAHDAEYAMNVRKRLNGLPDDVSSRQPRSDEEEQAQ